MDPTSLVLLALALSLDSLTVGLLYGARSIRLPWGAMIIVSAATGLLLGVAMAGGNLAAALLPPAAATKLGALLLAGVGLWITYQTWRNHGQRSSPSRPAALQPEKRVWRLKFGSVGVVIEILREPGAADMDGSGHVDPLEACFLGIALALDSVAAGLGAAMAGFSPFGLPLAAATGSLLLMAIGTRFAHAMPLKLEGRWALLHGLVLVALGVYRMVA